MNIAVVLKDLHLQLGGLDNRLGIYRIYVVASGVTHGVKEIVLTDLQLLKVGG